MGGKNLIDSTSPAGSHNGSYHILLCGGAYLSSFIAKMEKIYKIIGIILGGLIGCQLLLGGLIGCQLQDGVFY